MFRPVSKDRYLRSQLNRAVYFMVCFAVLLLIINATLHVATYRCECLILEVRALRRLPYDLEANRMPDDPVLVSIDAAGTIRINGARTSIAGIRPELRKALENVPTRSRYVVVKAARTLEYGRVVKVVDEVKGLPGTLVALQVDYLD
ncbi:MAG TPA: biopolymer transporter ExbD [Blastocatellia bacterium]|nr:biopolymer transporter ExbD [Blastocatellia bacterium]